MVQKGQGCLGLDGRGWKSQVARRGRRGADQGGKEVCSALVKRNPQGPLFRKEDGEAWTKDAIYNRFYCAAKRAGVDPRLSPYAYRHGMATRLLSSGVSESVAAAILGQFGTNTIHKFYSHLTANTDALHQGVGKLK